MGYEKNTPEQYIQITDKLLKEAEHAAELQAGYRWLSPGSAKAEHGKLVLVDQVFEIRKIIYSQLHLLDGAAVFAVSIGSGIDNWSRKFFEEDEPLAGYIADLIGSEIAEALADWLEAKIAAHALELGTKHSNRYSPGYCDWSVAEQHKLFSLLPDNFCGVRLNNSGLMVPQKSISGIVGTGAKMKWREYPCDRCSLETCYKQIHKSHETAS